MYLKRNYLWNIVAVILMLGVMGCSSNQEEATTTETPVNVVEEQLNFEHIESISLNAQDVVISDKNALSELHEILTKMELDEYSQSDDSAKKGFQVLIFTYDDGSSKKLSISANKAITIGDSSYRISNQVEIMDEISALFEKYAEQM